MKAVEIGWVAGGDDGSVESVEFIPNDRKLSAHKFETELETLGWEVYAKMYGGNTAGEFHTFGKCEIILNSDGSYTANSENTYQEDDNGEFLYNEKTDDYDIPNPDYESFDAETEAHSEITLPEIGT